ncbi:hypothetical protein OROMI_030499 [Orobanche minor]
MAESCICVLAHPGQPRTTKPNHDQLIVELSVTIGAISRNPVRKVSPKIHWSYKKTFHLSRQDIISPDSDIISTTIGNLEIPFSMQGDILWGRLDFPEDDRTPSGFCNLNEIKARLSETARRCAGDSTTGFMDIRIRKVEKLSPEDYDKLATGGGGNGDKKRQPLDGWIRENMKDLNLHRFTCMGLIQKLGMESPMDNRYFGLRSVRIEEEMSGDEGCSICLKGMKRDLEAIRMPCSHMFHGYCIFRWILVKPSCPFCRSELGFRPQLG